MKKMILLCAAVAGACGDDPMDETPDGGDEVPAAFTVRIENVAPWTVLKAGLASVGPIGPGQGYDVTFTAGRGQRLSFAAMLGQSNDWFFGPGPDGIALYDAQDAPIAGDVTAQIGLWNAGTEIDQEPGVGDATGPRQSAPDAGAPDPDPTVRSIPMVAPLTGGGTFTLPAIDQMIRVTVTPGANRAFTVRIQNVSTTSTLVTSQGTSQVNISPAVWTLHTMRAPIFEAGVADRGQGLELVAESGRGTTLSTVLGALAGWPTPISRGVYAVHRGESPLYTPGVADAGLGLERLAESGNPDPLAEALATGRTGLRASSRFTTPVGATQPGPARPGQAYELDVAALPGDRLSFVTMFGMSNDWFFASAPDGIALFMADGTPVSGDVTDRVGIYDAGTELDEELAIGPNTGPQQPSADSGPADPIRQVRAAEHPIPASAHVRVTVTPRDPHEYQ